jgi:integrase/recombinase XerD
MKKAMESFLTHLRLGNYSPKTISCHERNLRIFIFFLITHAGISDFQELTPQALLSYGEWVKKRKTNKGKPLTRSTQGATLTTATVFLTWAEKSGYLKKSVAWLLKQKRGPRPFPKTVFTQKEVAQIIAAQPNTLYGKRDKAMLEVLYGTGIRRGELRGLDVLDVDRSGEQLFIHKGKGQKDRIIPIPPYLKEILAHYTQEVRPRLNCKNPSENALFISGTGKRFREAGISTWACRIQTISGLPFSPHRFRHAYATHLLANGANLVHIQRLLGHEQISTTQIYTQILPLELMKVMAEKHPRNRDDSPFAAVELPRKNWKLSPLKGSWKAHRHVGQNLKGEVK